MKCSEKVLTTITKEKEKEKKSFDTICSIHLNVKGDEQQVNSTDFIIVSSCIRFYCIKYAVEFHGFIQYHKKTFESSAVQCALHTRRKSHVINSIRHERWRWRWKVKWIRWWLRFVRWIYTSWLCKSNDTPMITVFVSVQPFDIHIYSKWGKNMFPTTYWKISQEKPVPASNVFRHSN